MQSAVNGAGVLEAGVDAPRGPMVIGMIGHVNAAASNAECPNSASMRAVHEARGSDSGPRAGICGRAGGLGRLLRLQSRLRQLPRKAACPPAAITSSGGNPLHTESPPVSPCGASQRRPSDDDLATARLLKPRPQPLSISTTSAAVETAQVPTPVTGGGNAGFDSAGNLGEAGGNRRSIAAPAPCPFCRYMRSVFPEETSADRSVSSPASMAPMALPFDSGDLPWISRGAGGHGHGCACVTSAPAFVASAPAEVGGTLLDAEAPLVEGDPPLGAALTGLYRVGRQIGRGAYGVVLAAVRRSDETPVAVKVIERSRIPAAHWTVDSAVSDSPVPLEVALLRNLRHRNVIGLVDYIDDEQCVYLIMNLLPQRLENADPGDVTASADGFQDLFDTIEQQRRFTEAQAHAVFVQLLSALIYLLDEHGIVHRDIKDENVLVDAHLRVKLIDFGSAAVLPERGVAAEAASALHFSNFSGTLAYAAPEILAGQPYNGPSAEVWALGCCLYTMLVGTVPFSTREGALAGSFCLPDSVSVRGSCSDLLRAMLTASPAKRATLHELCTHPWVLGSYSGLGGSVRLW